MFGYLCFVYDLLQLLVNLKKIPYQFISRREIHHHKSILMRAILVYNIFDPFMDIPPTMDVWICNKLEALTQRAQTSLAEADHYSHIAYCKNVEPWL